MTTTTTPTFAQMQHFFRLVEGGKITIENFQGYLENPEMRMVSAGKENKPSFPSDAIAAEHGFTVVEDVAPIALKVKDLEYVSFLENGEDHINGQTMRIRATNLRANLGLVDGKFILDHQDEIPEEMRGKYIVLSGTLLRLSGVCFSVAYLRVHGDRWVLDFGWGDCRGGGRLVRCK